MRAYSDPRREDDPHALPDVEVFHAPDAEQCDRCGAIQLDGLTGGNTDACDCRSVYGVEPDETQREHVPGWYWWTCLPGCLPDSEPNGPFKTEAEALADAQADSDDDATCDDPGAHRPGCKCNGGEPLL